VAVVGAGPVGAALSGEWEGEVVWGPMLAAQYVLMCQITGSAIPATRSEIRLLNEFVSLSVANS
jgi:hypothetical protein